MKNNMFVATGSAKNTKLRLRGATVLLLRYEESSLNME